MKHIIKIKGLDCANCARELEEELNKIESVSSQVDFINQKVKFECDDKHLDKVLYEISHFEEVEIVNEEPIKNVVLKIEGLDCANCARELEEELNEIDGIDATVDFILQKVNLSYDSEGGLAKAKYAINHFEEVKIVEDNEKETVVLQRRSIRVCENLKAGTVITPDMVEELRPAPRDAIFPYQKEEIIGKKLVVDKENGDYLKSSDME